MFGIVPRPLWERRILPDDSNRIRLRARGLLLEGDGRVILIDNGVGDKQDDKLNRIFGVEFATGTLTDSLSRSGFSRSDVTDLILTHLHFDHCGGTTVRRGEDVEVAFPNATIHVQQGHWTSARAPGPRERASFLSENLDPIAESGQLRLVSGETELMAGIEVRVVSGHTDSMQVVRIFDEDRSLVYVADLLPTIHHASPAWNMAYDLRPLETMDEKAGLLGEACRSGWDLFFEHDPDVEVASVVDGDRGPEVAGMRPLTEL